MKICIRCKKPIVKENSIVPTFWQKGIGIGKGFCGHISCFPFNTMFDKYIDRNIEELKLKWKFQEAK